MAPRLNWQKRAFDFKPKRALKDEEEFCKTDWAARFIERAEQQPRARRHEQGKKAAETKRQAEADRHTPASGNRATPEKSNVFGLTTAHVDTIELFFRYLPTGVRNKTEAVHGKSLWATSCKDRFGNVVGYRIGLHQPKIAVLPVLEQFRQRHRGKLCRVDIAADLSTHSRAWIAQHSLLRWRKPGPLHEEENALYWVEQSSRSQRSNRDLVLYDDRPSKITGGPCTHLELRFYGTASVRKQRFEQVTDLMEINPRLLFQRHIKLVEFDPEALKKLQVRTAIKRDKAFYRGKETNSFVDMYRASIPRRVRSIIERAYQDRVQQFKNADPAYVNRLKSIPIDVLNLPDRLSWAL